MNNSSKIDKNAEIIRKRFEEFADEMLEYGLKIMSPTKALLGIKIGPIDHMARPAAKKIIAISGEFKKAREEIENQLNIVTELSKKLKKNNSMNSSSSILEINQYFEKFLKNDTLYRILETDEETEKEFASMKRRHFISLVNGFLKLLDGEGETYFDVVGSVCKTRKEAETLLYPQFSFLDEYRKYENLYKIPFKKETLRVMREGEKHAKERLEEDLDEIKYMG